MKLIHKVVVGSRLHNLYNENSDFDFRGVHMHDKRDVFNPFKKLKNTSWVEGDIDNTSYELMDFCKVATQGNPTILEVLFSNVIEETTEIGREMCVNREKFLDSHRIFDAFRGYAHNQYKKMSLFVPDDRTPKFAVAYLRVLEQGKHFLATGEMINQMEGELRDELMEVKYNWSNKLIPVLSKRIADLEAEFALVYSENQNRFKPDLEWIADFVYRSYTHE